MRTMDLRTRVSVYCGQERYGILRKVVVDPNDGHITDLVVEPAAHAATVRVVPVSLVTRVGVNKVHLGLSSQEIDRYPAYPQTTSPSIRVYPAGTGAAAFDGLGSDSPPHSDMKVPAEWMRQRDDSAPAVRMGATSGAGIAPGTPVLCGDGRLATVDHAVVDPATQRQIYLTLRYGRVADYRMVPVEVIRPGCNGLLLAPDVWSNLPMYVPREDDEIYEEICSTVRECAGDVYDKLSFTVEKGLVTLLGEPDAEGLLAEIAELVSAIPGVIDLRTSLSF